MDSLILIVCLTQTSSVVKSMSTSLSQALVLVTLLVAFVLYLNQVDRIISSEDPAREQQIYFFHLCSRAVGCVIDVLKTKVSGKVKTVYFIRTI